MPRKPQWSVPFSFNPSEKMKEEAKQLRADNELLKEENNNLAAEVLKLARLLHRNGIKLEDV